LTSTYPIHIVRRTRSSGLPTHTPNANTPDIINKTETSIMPPKRSSTVGRTTSASRQQSTLAFNGKNSRVTKASQQNQQHGKSLDKKKELLFDEAVTRADLQPDDDDDVVEITSQSTTADKAVEQQAEVETRALEKASSHKPEEALTGGSKTEDVLGGRAQTSDIGAVNGPAGSGWVGDEEKRARKITETQIKKFWREKESARLVPRVHQEDLAVHERVLRLWDVSGEYGVSFECLFCGCMGSMANFGLCSLASVSLD
jgi:DNA polymerase delta subunit 4